MIDAAINKLLNTILDSRIILREMFFKTVCYPININRNIVYDQNLKKNVFFDLWITESLGVYLDGYGISMCFM